MSDNSNWGELNPLYLDGAAGKLFAVYYAPPETMAARASVLLVPPFAEEMNKSRHVYASLARSLCGRGYGVLSFDLFGTGDSAGDFADARWDIWLEDMHTAVRYLEDHVAPRPVLLGLRFAALLSFAYLRLAPQAIASWHGWQPVTDGKSMLNQFLRLRLAAGMAAGTNEKETTAGLRARLSAGETLEIAGYSLTPELAAAIDAQTLNAPFPHGAPSMHWWEICSDRRATLSPASQRAIDGLRAQGLHVETHQVSDAPFWTLPEITPAPALLAATLKGFERASSA